MNFFENFYSFWKFWQHLTILTILMIWNQFNNFLIILTFLAILTNLFWQFWTILDNFKQFGTILENFQEFLIIFDNFDNWLQFWKLRSWIQTNIYLTMNCDTGQHSQFLQCFDCISWKNLVEGFLQVNLVHRELQTPKSMMTILDSKCSRFKALLRNSYLSQVMLRWSRDACILFPRMFWFRSPSSPKIEKYIQESFENG